MSTGTQTDVLMSQMESQSFEGTVTRWLKQEGDAVVTDELVLELATDKVDTEGTVAGRRRPRSRPWR